MRTLTRLSTAIFGLAAITAILPAAPATSPEIQELRDEIRADGYPLLLQQSGVPTAALCDEFRAIRESVLFGRSPLPAAIVERGIEMFGMRQLLQLSPFDVPSIRIGPEGNVNLPDFFDAVEGLIYGREKVFRRG